MDTQAIIKEMWERFAEGELKSAAYRKETDFSSANLAKYIDHTLLKADATAADIEKVCEDAMEYRFASVCVQPFYIGLVAALLKESGVAPCCVIGFPLGANMSEAKSMEADIAVMSGARELDMVINIGAIKNGEWIAVKEDVEGVVEAANGDALVKVILETCLLTKEEIVRACVACKAAGADFVKTSTGFSTGGATVDDVRLMREVVGIDMGVKASGGVRTYDDAVNMLKAGANRLGTSAGVAIVKGGASEEIY